MATRSAGELDRAGLLRVALLVAGDAPLAEVFAATSEQVARRLGVEAGAVLRYVGDERAVVVGVWRDGGNRGFPVNAELDFDRRNSAAGRVRATGRPARADSYETSRGELPVVMQAVGLKSTVAAPVMAGETVWGVLIGSTERDEPLEAGAEDRIADLADLASRAVSHREAGRRVLEAADEDRRRLERQLHEGVQQHLLALGLKLRAARAGDGEALLAEAVDDALTINDELREFARDLYPTVLAERGLAAAVQAVAARAGLRVDLRELPRHRHPPLAEATAYFLVAEALAAAARAAPEEPAAVTVTERGAVIAIEVEHPGADAAALADRVAALGGRLETGGGVRAEIPDRLA